MIEASAAGLIRQHLIDPEICIRCNTCESTCPVGAISHDARNYVVDANICNLCMACVPPCPTGSIDNWRAMPRARAYSVEAQFGWDALPAELSADDLALAGAAADASLPPRPRRVSPDAPGKAAFDASAYGAVVPPWSAERAIANLYGPKAAARSVSATVVGNVRVTDVGKTTTPITSCSISARPRSRCWRASRSASSLRASMPDGRPHFPRQYSVASPRNGERPGYNNVSLTVKRVLEDHQGRPVRGVASNYLCDLKVGDAVEATGPFGLSFLMPNHPKSAIVMICTGTGSAPMRAMTEWRRRLRKSGKFEGGKLMLFFGARTKEELPYFGPLGNLPRDFIDINFAFSRTRRRAQALCAGRDARAGRRSRPAHRRPGRLFLRLRPESDGGGRGQALRDIAIEAGLDWETNGQALKRDGRLHLETY